MNANCLVDDKISRRTQVRRVSDSVTCKPKKKYVQVSIRLCAGEAVWMIQDLERLSRDGPVTPVLGQDVAAQLPGSERNTSRVCDPRYTAKIETSVYLPVRSYRAMDESMRILRTTKASIIDSAVAAFTVYLSTLDDKDLPRRRANERWTKALYVSHAILYYHRQLVSRQRSLLTD